MKNVRKLISQQLMGRKNCICRLEGATLISDISCLFELCEIRRTFEINPLDPEADDFENNTIWCVWKICKSNEI